MNILDKIPTNKELQVVVGNKFDLTKNRGVVSRKYPYLNVSIHAKHNTEKLLLYILRRLTHKNNLVFV